MVQINIGLGEMYLDLEEIRDILKSTQTILAGSSAVVAQYSKEIGLPEIVNKLVTWDRSRKGISPGTLIQALVINILGDRKALYRVSEFYRDKDLETIFDEDVTADALNDSALARALDKMHEAGCQKIFSEVALSAIAAHDVPIGPVHFDTTSMSVEGEYNGEEEDAISVTYGYSKDKRPDLKQIMFGVGSNHEGIPFFGQVLSGNQDDMTWNSQVVEKIDTIIPDEFISEVIYVSDCAMVTLDTLRKASSNDLKFISRMPARFKLAGELARASWVDEKPWTQMGKLSSGQKAASYETKSYFSEIDGMPHRFVVVHSSTLDGRKKKALGKMMEAERAKIEKEASLLRRRDFVCEPDARRALTRFMDKWQGGFHELSGHVTVGMEKEKREKRGRPRKDAPKPPVTVSFNADIKVAGVNEERLKKEQRIRSTFILITNLMDEEEYPDGAILTEYKAQPTVENLFRFIKSPYVLGPVFVKKPSRVEALGYVLLMALLIAMLLQRRVRENLAKEETPLQIPGKVKTFMPTVRMILDMLDTVKIQKLVIEGQTLRSWPEQDGLFDLSRLLRLAGVSKSAYTEPSWST